VSDELQHEYDTVVIGGGQTGLIVGHALQEKGTDYVILDAGPRVGDVWRNRWDSLRLFTPARLNGLPGMDFPASGSSFVTKDQIADFLEEYARAMDLRVRSNARVTGLEHNGSRYVVHVGGQEIKARNVIVAMANYQLPKVPDFAPKLDPGIVQMHSSEYKNASQLQDGTVLVVGLGNSGADIAYDVSATHETIVSGSESGSIPFALESWFGRNVGTRLVRFVMVRVLNTSNPIGRKARPKMLGKAAPLVRVRGKELERAGVSRVDRISGIEDGKPITKDDQVLDIANVIWCTGYRPGFDWIDLPIFDDDGQPIHERGIVRDMPGLYFVGLFFLHALWSETITGVQPDVRYIVKHLPTREAAGTKA
jgi:putative flavoprotein involved in K+ transport